MKRPPRPQTNFSTRHLFAHSIFELNLGFVADTPFFWTIYFPFILHSYPELLSTNISRCCWKNEFIIYSLPVSHNFTAAQMLIGGSDDSAKCCIVPCGQDTSEKERESTSCLHICFRLPFQTLPCALLLANKGSVSLCTKLLVQIHNGIYRAHHALLISITAHKSAAIEKERDDLRAGGCERASGEHPHPPANQLHP
jgi:hypothetical protein